MACPIRAPCAEYSLNLPVTDSAVWAGMSQTTRLRKKRDAAAMRRELLKQHQRGWRQNPDGELAGDLIPYPGRPALRWPHADRCAEAAMKDWTEMPEAAGVQSEGELYGLTYGSPGMPTIGAIPPRQPREQMERERAEADRRWQTRQRVEAAATAISISAMEGQDAGGPGAARGRSGG